MPEALSTIHVKMKASFIPFHKIMPGLRRAWHRLMDYLLPPLCLGCDRPVTQNQTLCAECWKAMHFIAPPFCARCGAPFDLPVEDGTLCGACLAEEPVYTAARSVMLYNEASKPIILRFKHADRLHPVPALAQWIVRAGETYWPEIDVITPVPLHRWRLLKRRYNQSALLAQAVAALVHKPVLVDLIVRVRATVSQGHCSRKERLENVAGAFALRGGQEIKGKRVALIDDVLTSGATVNECARALFAAGAEAVYVLTLARARIAN